ncbi:MAG: hypothetical protein ACUZ8H_06870 [Candidatus Anammoxibacter sp.]
MESINSILNTVSRPVLNVPEKLPGKRGLAAYNVDFKSVINSAVVTGYPENSNSIQNNIYNDISGAKQHDVNNHEYNKFVNNSKRSSIPYRLRSKRFLERFRPVPMAKASPKVGTPEKEIDKPVLKSGLVQQIIKYKEDQLLSNPGGDNFFPERHEMVIDNTFDHSTFSNRVGKDLSDSYANLKNLIKDLGNGSEIKYLDMSGSIKTRKNVGLAKTVGKFFGNIASGLSFGVYTQNNEEPPVGVKDKITHFFKKVFVDAIGKDLLVGVPQSIINIGEDAMFVGLNLLEAIPDATVGHTKLGRKITTQVFDNVQVALDFATDIMPGGEASTRMRASLVKKIFTNQGAANETPQYVRSSPFRKAIETLSFFMPFKI